MGKELFVTEPLESKDKVLAASDYHCSKKGYAVMKCELIIEFIINK